MTSHVKSDMGSDMSSDNGSSRHSAPRQHEGVGRCKGVACDEYAAGLRGNREAR